MGFIRRTFVILVSVISAVSLSSAVSLADDAKKALVIIDMQSEFMTRDSWDKKPGNQKKIDALLVEQVKAVWRAREAKIPILFVEYEDSGPTNRRLTRAAETYAKRITIRKNEDGMFDDLQARAWILSFLKEHQVDTLIVAGANGGACVQESIRGSLANGYNVIAFSEGIADFNYEAFLYPYVGYYEHFQVAYPSGAVFTEVPKLNDILPPAKKKDPSSKAAGKKKTGQQLGASAPAADPRSCPADGESPVDKLCDGIKGAIEVQGDSP